MSRRARFPVGFCAVIISISISFSGNTGVFAAGYRESPSQTYLVARNNVPPLRPTSEVRRTVYRYETANFVIENAPTAEMAREFGDTAESSRERLAVLWFGRTLRDWPEKCPIRFKVGDVGAAGETSFIFHSDGTVDGWEMSVQGTRERIVDSVLPHEISHMVFATAFRKKIPRWLDEGAATSLEHEAERSKYRRMLLQFVDPNVRRAIPFNRMVEIQGDYPSDFMPLYSQGNSVAEFLIGQGGHRRFASFAEKGMQNNDWNGAVREFYGYENLGDLQQVWIRWVGAGFPSLETYEPALARNRNFESDPSRTVGLNESRRSPEIPDYETVIVGKSL